MKAWIESVFPSHYSLLSELASIPAPSHDEWRRAERILCILRGMGAEAYSDGAGNVIAPFGCDGRDDITVYSAHTDVVFGDTSPLPVREEGGRLYAPGVGDDTANVAAMITIIRYIKEHGLRPVRPVMFVFNTCEEGLGNLKGTRRLFEDHAGRIRELVSFDCAFEEGMITRAVGSERWRVTCRAQGGHSYNSFGNSNAIHRLAELIAALYRQPVPRLEGAKATYNVGMIEGGTSVNTIAESASMLYEYRSDDRRALEALRNSFFDTIKQNEAADALFTTELIGERPCGGEVDEDALAALIKRCGAVYASVMGAEPKTTSGSTDANIPLSLGIPAVTFGLYSGEGAHTREEWLDISSLKAGLLIGIRLVTEGYFK